MTEVGVKVFWDHVQASDLAGYKVYRRTGSQAKPELAGEVNLPYNMFIDKKASKGTEIFYSVTSFDNRKPANESEKTPEVRVQN